MLHFISQSAFCRTPSPRELLQEFRREWEKLRTLLEKQGMRAILVKDNSFNENFIKMLKNKSIKDIRRALNDVGTKFSPEEKESALALEYSRRGSMTIDTEPAETWAEFWAQKHDDETSSLSPNNGIAKTLILCAGKKYGHYRTEGNKEIFILNKGRLHENDNVTTVDIGKETEPDVLGDLKHGETWATLRQKGMFDVIIDEFCPVNILPYLYENVAGLLKPGGLYLGKQKIFFGFPKKKYDSDGELVAS